MIEGYDPLSDPPESKTTDKTLDTMQRLIVQNLFDTQPKRRSAYMSRLGYELNPKDDNEYRIKGSDTGYIEIDPGFGSSYNKGGLKEVGKEILRDIGDIGFDTLANSMIARSATIGAAGGSAIGAATAGLPAMATPPLLPVALLLGGGVGGISGGIAGGAVGNASAESIKKMAGDLLLDDNVPLDNHSMVLQSLFTGLVPSVMKGGEKLLKTGFAGFLNQRKESIVNAIKSSGTGITQDIINKAIENPKMFSKEAVTGANERLKQTFRGLFGIDDPLKLDAPDSIRGGAFGKVMSVQNELANKEIEALATNPKANFKVSEIAQQLIALKEKLNSKYSKTADEKAAIGFINEKLSELQEKSAAKETTTVSSILDQWGNKVENTVKKEETELTFKEAREFMSSIQSEVSAKDTAGNYINAAGRILSPAINGETGVLKVLNDKASSVGSVLPEINATRSRILNAYNTATEVITPNNITSAFVGNDTVRKSMIRDAAVEIGDVLGDEGKLVKSIEDGSMQRVIENMYDNKKAMPSGAINAAITSSSIGKGMKGAVAGGAAGYAVGGKELAGPAAIVGAVGGALKGAQEGALLANPELLLEKLGKNSAKQSALESSVPRTPGVIENVVTMDTARSLGIDENTAPEKEYDPLLDD